MSSNPGHAVLDEFGRIIVMVGHILNDFMLPTTFFSLQVELASSHPLFASDSSKMFGWSPTGGRG